MMSTMRLGRTVAKRAFSTTAAARYVRMMPPAIVPLLCPAQAPFHFSLAHNAGLGYEQVMRPSSSLRFSTGGPGGRHIRMLRIPRSVAGGCAETGLLVNKSYRATLKDDGDGIRHVH